MHSHFIYIYIVLGIFMKKVLALGLVMFLGSPLSYDFNHDGLTCGGGGKCYCSSDSDCGVGAYCNRPTSQCKCNDDRACSNGQYCHKFGKECRCNNDSNCPYGQECQKFAKVCKCRNDSQCPNGQKCDWRGYCQCRNDSECR